MRYSSAKDLALAVGGGGFPSATVYGPYNPDPAKVPPGKRVPGSAPFFGNWVIDENGYTDGSVTYGPEADRAIQERAVNGGPRMQDMWKALFQAAQSGGQESPQRPNTRVDEAGPNGWQRPNTRPPVMPQAPPTKPGGGMYQGSGQKPQQQSQGNTFSNEQIQDAVKNFTPYGGGGFAGKAGRTSQSQTQAPSQQPDVSAWGSHLYG